MSSKNTIIGVVALVAILAAGLYFYQTSLTSAPPASVMPSAESIEEQPATTTPATSPQDVTNVENGESVIAPPSNEAQQQNSSAAANIDVQAALAVRAIGNPNAPVVIREHSSLTCGHCGEFHRSVFDQIKAEYIDTGKVYVIFSDFPLNGPALHATMAARCLPADRYFSYVDLLFKNQDKWAFEPNYMAYLRQNAALAGLGNEAFDACINNEELRQGVMNMIREAQQKYEINSTPTLIINEDNSQTGARDFAYYKQIIDAELAGAE